MNLLGQNSYRASKRVRDEAPFGDDIAWRRLLAIRGRTGAVLMMQPLQSESAEYIVEALTENFSEAQLQTIRHIGTDSPSEKLANQLKVVCPGLCSLMLDSIYLAIVYEYGFWNKKSTGSKILRRILWKCIAVDTSLTGNHWQEAYNGSTARPLSSAETRYRDMMLDFSMSAEESASILNDLQEDKPFYHRVEFIKCLAALCQRFPAEMSKTIAGAIKHIHKILWSACAPDRLEWLINNLRVRHQMQPPSYRWFLPSGTASNEALHAEITSWSRSVNVMYRSTLALKLLYFRCIKMLMHYLSVQFLMRYLSVQFPHSHVVSAGMMLGRSLHESLCNEEEWTAWCTDQRSEPVQAKASVPLTTGRQHEARVVRQHLKKKPSSKKMVIYQREQDACESIGREAEPHPPNGRGARIRVSMHETRMQGI